MEIKRLFDVLDYQLVDNPLPDALVAKQNGQWEKLSTENVKSHVNSLSAGLISAGIQVSDKVGIVSFNRPEWVIADFSISQIGAIDVPMYPNSTPADYAFIINDAKVKRYYKR